MQNCDFPPITLHMSWKRYSDTCSFMRKVSRKAYVQAVSSDVITDDLSDPISPIFWPFFISINNTDTLEAVQDGDYNRTRKQSHYYLNRRLFHEAYPMARGTNVDDLEWPWRSFQLLQLVLSALKVLSALAVLWRLLRYINILTYLLTYSWKQCLHSLGCVVNASYQLVSP